MSNQDFRVTTSRRGGRSFLGGGRNEHDDRVGNNQGGNRYRQNNRNSRGRGRNNGPNPRSYLDDDDIDMDRGQRPRNRSRYVERMVTVPYPSVFYSSSGHRVYTIPHFSTPYGGGNTYQHPNARNRGGDRGGYNNRSHDDRGPSNYRGGGGGRNVPRGGASGRNARNNYMQQQGRRGNFSRDGWYKVVIPSGTKAGKEFILTSLASMTDIPFVPVGFAFDHNNAVFYVDGKHAAAALQNCTRRIVMPNDLKMVVSVNWSSHPPPVRLTPEAMEKIKLCMSKRYDPATKSLNLGSFSQDDDFKSNQLHIYVYRKDVMDCILRTVKENIPELESLDLSYNGLVTLDGLRTLEASAPSLTHLNLGNNKIKAEYELDQVKLPLLQELCLDGNPMCDRFRDETAYISAIRKRYPKVIKLDGTQLPPPITFDIEEGGGPRLPTSKGSFFLNEPVKDLVCRFLEQYYALYDSSNRQDLINAYHDQAFFSLYTCNYKQMNTKNVHFKEYFVHTRNLKRIGQNIGLKTKTLKIGRLPIVTLLTELPATKHDPAAFIVDVSHASENLMTFTVNGLFKETDNKSNYSPVLTFSRMFVTVPQGAGIVIVNEQLTIGVATPEQCKTAFKTPAPTPSSSPVQDSSSGALALPAAGASGGPNTQQQAMVMQFCQHSGMNLDWATKCLQENNWNYDLAAKVFMELNSKGTIPPEAFK